MSSGTARRALAAIGAGVCLALVGVAFAVAPSSCDGGLERYFLSGVGGVIVLASMPFVLPVAASPAARVGLGMLLAGAGAGTWTAGLFVANVRFICRLI